MDDQTIELAKYRIEKAGEELKAAKYLYEKDIIKSSLSSSYYSIFHSARALLVFKKLDSKKHSGVIALFNKEYIKTGLIKEKAKDILSKAFYIRIESDYKDFYVASKEEAKEQIDNAEFFLNEILEFIKRQYNVELK
ncbi:MAG: HEPN domain-containing protein [Ignavibacteriaceae bacterium]